MRNGRSLSGLVAVGSVAFVLASGLAARSEPDDRVGLAANPLFQRLVRQGAGVHSSVADVDVHTQLKSFPPASFTFHGHSYFLAPDKQAVVFDNVPKMLRGMFRDQPSIAPAGEWPRVYDATVAGDDGTVTTFHLVPKDAASPIDHADALVDDRSALVTRYAFENKNGSTVTTDNTYVRVGGHELVKTAIGEATGRGYRADVTTTFSNYRLNGPVPDDAFDGGS